MNRHLILPAAIFVIMMPLSLTGCGNKGPLLLPDQTADTAVPAVQAAVVESGAQQDAGADSDAEDAVPPEPEASDTPVR